MRYFSMLSSGWSMILYPRSQGRLDYWRSSSRPRMAGAGGSRDTRQKRVQTGKTSGECERTSITILIVSSFIVNAGGIRCTMQGFLKELFFNTNC
jgi:hypothetical protein